MGALGTLDNSDLGFQFGEHLDGLDHGLPRDLRWIEPSVKTDNDSVVSV